MDSNATANQAWAQTARNLQGIGQARLQTAQSRADYEQYMMLERQRVQREIANEALVKIMGDGSLDKDARLKAVFEIPRIWDTPVGQQMIQERLQQQMIPQYEIDYKNSQTAENTARAQYWRERPDPLNVQQNAMLTPEEQRQAALVKGGLAPRAVSAKPSSVSQQKWDMLSEEEQSRAARIFGGLEPKAAVQRPESVPQQQWDMLSDEDKELASRISAGIEPRAKIQNPQNQAVLIKHWQDVIKKSFKPVYDQYGIQTGSEVIPGQEETIDYAKSQIEALVGPGRETPPIPNMSTGGIVPEGSHTTPAAIPPYEANPEAPATQMPQGAGPSHSQHYLAKKATQGAEPPLPEKRPEQTDILGNPVIPPKTSLAQRGIEVTSTLERFGLSREQTDYVAEKLSKFTDNDQAEFVEILRSGNITAIQKALNVLNGN
jgi:hypothetical protein